MNYGDIMMMRREGVVKSEIIKEIYETFKVDADDIERAASAARVGYPNEPIQYYFLADCVRTGRNLKEDYDLESEMGAEIMDAVREAADMKLMHTQILVLNRH